MGPSGDSLTVPAGDIQPWAAPLAPFAYSDEVRHAGFWIRLAAYLIDAVLLEIAALSAGFLLGVVIAIVGIATKLSLDRDVFQNAGAAMGLAAGLFYYGFFAGGRWQATPGKRLLGLHIIRTDGQRIGYGLAVGRYLAYIPSSLILGIGFLMIGWNEEKKGLHDMICKTRVVHGRPQPRNVATAFE